jgi:predicted AAA+ superfamily ATPase
LSAREIIPNVYVAGSPLATASKVFKGRRDLFLALERELATAAETRPTLLLFGARRCGKTSALCGQRGGVSSEGISRRAFWEDVTNGLQ